MGFFSWITSDTKKRITNTYSSKGAKPSPVYMITEDGRHWKEDDYEGYGVFGGKDIYVLIAELNGLKPKPLKTPFQNKGDDKNELLRQQAITFLSGSGITKGKTVYEAGGVDFFNWDEPLKSGEGRGYSPNELLDKGWKNTDKGYSDNWDKAAKAGIKLPKLVEHLPSPTAWKKTWDSLPYPKSDSRQGYFNQGGNINPKTMATRKELENKIERYTTGINANTMSPAFIENLKVKRTAAEKELAELIDSEVPKEKVEKAVAVAVSKAKAQAKGKGKTKAKKEAKKDKPAHVINKEKRTVTIEGVEYNVDKCDEAVDAWYAQKERAAKSGKKFAKKSSGEVIGDKLVSTGEKVLSSIKKTDVDKKPTFYKDKLEELSKVMTKLASLIDDLVGKGDASDEVKGFVKQIAAYIKKHLSK